MEEDSTRDPSAGDARLSSPSPASEALYRLFSELTSDFLYILRVIPDGRLKGEWVSEAFTRFVGYSLEEVEASGTWMSIVHPEDVSTVRQMVERLRSGQQDRREFRICTREGEVRWLQNYSRPAWDGDEQRVVRIYGAVQDITERKRTHQALTHRLAIERLVTSISTQFINLGHGEMDRAIDQALQKIGEFAGADRSYLFLYAADGSVEKSCEWCAGGVTSHVGDLLGVEPGTFSWWEQQLQQGGIVRIRSLSHLPPEAKAERETLASQGVQSLVSVPMYARGTMIGHLGFDSVRAEREWVEEDLALLRLAGEIFASALEREKAERKLCQQKGLYESLLQVQSDQGRTFVVLDLENRRILNASETFCRLVGYSKDELLALSSVAMLSPPEKQAALMKRLERWSQEGTALDPCELTVLHKAGHAVHLEVFTDQVYVVDGRRRAITTVRDITQRKQIEEERRIKDSAIASSISAIAFADLDARLTYVNDAFLALWGYDSREEVLGRPTAAFWQAPERARHVVDALHGEGAWTGEMVARRRDGSPFDAQLLANMVRDEAGRPICLMASFIDVTERKRSEEMVRALLDATTESMMLTDAETTILALNETAAQRFNRQVDELIGMQIDDLVDEGLLPPVLAESRRAWVEQVIRSKEPLRFEDERQGMILDINIFPVFDADGEVDRLAIFARDITVQRQAQQQAARAERLAAMGRLAAALAHEVNNPLQAIRSNLELALDFPLESEEREGYLEIVREEMERLAGTARRILEFARPVEETRCSVSVVQLMEKTLRLVRRQLEGCCIEVTTNYDPDLPLLMVAPGQIIEVFLNLTLNAIEAMSEGGHLHIEVSVRDGEVAIAMVNEGSHIPAQHIEQIFDPFFTTKPEGTGLGLAISHSIMQKHDGTITVQNREGEPGVVFTITFPLPPTAERQEALL